MEAGQTVGSLFIWHLTSDAKWLAQHPEGGPEGAAPAIWQDVVACTWMYRQSFWC